MSAEAMKWAKAQKLTGTAKVTLLALAWYANTNGEAWPSQQTLADHTGLGVRTIRRAMATLEACGAIKRRVRSQGAAGRSSDHVELPLHRTLRVPKKPRRRSVPTGQSGRMGKANSQPANLSVPTGQSGRGIGSDQQTLIQEGGEGSSDTLEADANCAADPWAGFRVIAGGRT